MATGGGATSDIPGYKIGARLYAGSDWALFEAVKIDSGRTGLLRMLTSEVPARRKHVLSRAKLFDELKLPCSAAVLDLADRDSEDVYVFFEGEARNLLHMKLREQRLAPAEIIALAGQLSLTLRDLSAASIVYLDLRPDTILWETGSSASGSSSPGGRLRILPGDMVKFQKAQARQVTLSEETFPPPWAAMRPYQPEEQRAGAEHLDERAMVYSMAAVIYELLWGEPPPEAIPQQLPPSDLSDVEREPLVQYLRELIGEMLTINPPFRPSVQHVATRAQWLAKMSSMIGSPIEGRYRPERVLSLGGMGAVLLAVDERVSTNEVAAKVAIKVPYPESDKARIDQEITAIIHAGQKSNDIVEIVDRGTLPEIGPYIVMRFLEGETLKTRMQKRGMLDVQEALLIAERLAVALCTIHRQGIFHRDVKPENVMIVADPAMPNGERYKLLDFGIARVASVEPTRGKRVTSVGMRMGTHGYIAPEQNIDASTATSKADVFSLGAMLYEMVSGHLPALPRLRWHGSPALLRLLARMMDDSPENRPDMNAVYERLHQIRTRRTLLKRIGLVIAIVGVGAVALLIIATRETNAPDSTTPPLAAQTARGRHAQAPQLDSTAGMGHKDAGLEVPTTARDASRTDLSVALPELPMQEQGMSPVDRRSDTSDQKARQNEPRARSDGATSLQTSLPDATAPLRKPNSDGRATCKKEDVRPLTEQCFPLASWTREAREKLQQSIQNIPRKAGSTASLCLDDPISILGYDFRGVPTEIRNGRRWLRDLIHDLGSLPADKRPSVPFMIECK